MRTLRNLLILAILVTGCKSVEKLMLQGNYDMAIEKGLKKAVKGKAKNDDYAQLDKAYTLANTRDNEYIESLMAEGKPENWDRIYQTYMRLDNRQKRMRTILPFNLNGQTVNYTQVDYAQLKADAKSNAANYYYNNGNKLLTQGDKLSARKAYDNFKRAKSYNASKYPDLDRKMDTARGVGMTYVNLNSVNQTRVRFPKIFFEEVNTYDITKLESFWVDYTIGDNGRNLPYDISIAVQIRNAQFSPEKEESKEYIKRKQIQDGSEIMKDASGKVMLDSLGKPMRKITYKEVSCKYKEHKQYKDVVLKCNLEYYDIHKQSVIKSLPFEVVTVFEHASAIALGDERALDPQERIALKNKKVAYPSRQQLLIDAAPQIALSVNKMLIANKKIIW